MKKILLTLVPALMLLGSCSGAQPQVENKLFQEDTLAHEEVFGSPEVDKKVRKNTVSITTTETPLAPKIGVRVKNNNNGTHSIRFLAAITVDNFSTVKASWSRTMYYATGSVQKETRSNIDCTYAYAQLVNETGSGFIKITDEAYSGYSCFVVYTMLGIPDANLGSYLNAQLSVDCDDNTFDFTTDIVSSTIDESKQISFDPASITKDFFLLGKFGDNTNYVVEQDYPTKGDKPEDNLASFTYNMEAGDNFYIVNYSTSPSTFRVYDSAVLRGTNNPIGYYFSDNAGKIEANYKGSYVLYLNKQVANELWTSASDVVRPIYIKPTDVGGLSNWWGKDGRWTAVYAFNEDVVPKKEKWFNVTTSGDYMVTTEAIDPTEYKTVIFVEMKSDATEPGWGGKNNQTSNKDLSTTTEDCAYLKDDGWGTKYADWGTR